MVSLVLVEGFSISGDKRESPTPFSEMTCKREAVKEGDTGFPHATPRSKFKGSGWL